MKHRLIWLTLLLLISQPVSADNQTNYIRERTFIRSDTSQHIDDYRLFDGFGRPVAATRGGVLASGNSLVELVDYDEGGRKAREWLPVPAACPGIFDNLDGLRGYYHTNHGDTAAYTQTGYDGLDRVTRTWAPGTAFRSRPATTEYRLNEASDSVRHYSVPLFADNLVTGGFHAASQLRKVVTTDPDQRQVTQFIDRRGNMILERRHNGNEKIDTYYVYDVKGRLRMVLQPEYQRTQNLALYAYRYRYDSRGRCIFRKLPGCGAVQYWFDTRDRVTAVQDSVLRSQGLYRVFTYDGLDRPLTQGLAASPTGTATTLELVNHYVSYDFVPAGYGPMASAITGSGSQQNTCPARLTGTWQKASDGSETLTVVGYDSYNRRNRTQTYGPYGLMQDDVTWYDFDGAVDSTATTVRRISDQGLVFSGTLHNHYFDIQHTRVLQSSDLSVTDAAGHTQDRTIRSLVYDALGRVTSNNRGHNAVSMAYQYNPLRGWITQISTADDGFQQKLYREDNPGNPLYNGSISAMTWQVPGSSYVRRYDYTYDGMNRLTEGAYSHLPRMNPWILLSVGEDPLALGESEGQAMPLELIPVTGGDLIGPGNINAAGRYSERIRYDKNSNVSDVARYGMNNLRSYGVIDSLEITRSGNQLVAIEDHAEKNLTYTGASDFVDGTNFSEEYAYDGNGRLTMDTNRGIASIAYDLCNNPQAIAFSGTNGIQYVYAPDGTRLRTVHVLSGIGGSVTRDTTDYLGNLVMRDGHLSIYRFDGGYVSLSNDTIDGWHYYIQDYMGNNRMVVNSDGTIEQVTHYYPYGGVIGDISTNENLQKYKFEGKELDRTFGLDNYDIHARQYYAMMPSWDRIDKKAEDYYHLSPYSYCAGNPVNLGDYDGMDIWEIDNEGRIRNHIEDKTQDAFYMVELNDSGEYERTFTIDEDGNIVYNSISFAYGTVESQKSISYSPNNKDVDKYDIYQVRGDENGKALFEFFGRNVAENRIEVGHIMCGVEGEKGLNFVLNSHHKPEYYVEDGVKHIRSSEPATPELYNKRLRYGYHIRAFIHSHPNSDKPSKADMIFKQLVENNYIRLGSKTPATKIWVVSSGLYISF
jgi:RHS repeat-associated protein